MPATGVAHQDQNFLGRRLNPHAIEGRPIVLNNPGSVVFNGGLLSGGEPAGSRGPNWGPLTVGLDEAIELVEETLELGGRPLEGERDRRPAEGGGVRAVAGGGSRRPSSSSRPKPRW